MYASILSSNTHAPNVLANEHELLNLCIYKHRKVKTKNNKKKKKKDDKEDKIRIYIATLYIWVCVCVCVSLYMLGLISIRDPMIFFRTIVYRHGSSLTDWVTSRYYTSIHCTCGYMYSLALSLSLRLKHFDTNRHTKVPGRIERVKCALFHFLFIYLYFYSRYAGTQMLYW